MGEHWFRYGDERIPYKVCFTPNRTRHVTINVHPSGLIHVDAPDGTEEGDIRAAVTKRARWISTQRAAALAQQATRRAREYKSGEGLLYLGRQYKLLVRAELKGMPPARMRGGNIEVAAPVGDSATVRARLLAWYRERARNHFDRRMTALAGQLNWVSESPPFTLRSMKRQWGNCTADGAIVLNPSLIKAPRECVDYVLLHEITHLLEHNHSPAFYRVLDRVMPEWLSIKLRLDGMAAELLFDFV